MADVLGYIYASAVLFTGFWEFYETRSHWLFGADLACGCALAYGASQDSGEPGNYVVLLVISMIVAGVMTHRFLNTNRRLLPVIVFILSILIFLLTGLSLIIRDIVDPFLDKLFSDLFT